MDSAKSFLRGVMLERIANGNQMSGDEILELINSQGVRPDTLLNQIRAELLWNKIVRGRYKRVKRRHFIGFKSSRRKTLHPVSSRCIYKG